MVDDIELTDTDEQLLDQPEPAEGAKEESTEQTESADKPIVTSLFQADGKRLDPAIRTTLDKLKAESPDAGKLIAKALYRVADLDREFPGGLTEIRELRDKVEKFGGVDGIQEKLDGAKELYTLADQFAAADPAFVEDMLASSPESFAALAPIITAKWAEVQPEGFTSYIGRIVFNDLNKNNIPLTIMRMADVLGDNAKALEYLEQLNTYLGGYKTLAEKRVESPKPGAAKTAPKTDDLAKREETLRSQEWKVERDTIQRTAMDAEYSRALAGRKPDTEEKAQILELFRSRSIAKADQLFPGWQEKAQRFIKANDKAGYLRYIKSIYTRIVPETMASAVNSTMRGKKAATPAATPKPAPQLKTATAQQPPAKGFKFVSGEPNSFDINYSYTDKQMLSQNRAILKDGTRVQWRG